MQLNFPPHIGMRQYVASNTHIYFHTSTLNHVQSDKT